MILDSLALRGVAVYVDRLTSFCRSLMNTISDKRTPGQALDGVTYAFEHPNVLSVLLSANTRHQGVNEAHNCSDFAILGLLPQHAY